MKILLSLTLAALAFTAGAANPGILSLSGPNPNAFNISNVTAHATQQAATNNSFNLYTNGVATGGWVTNGETINTNGVFAHQGTGFGFVLHAVNLPYQADSHFITRYIIGANGIQTGGAGVWTGFSTNTAGAAPTDNGQFVGFGFDSSSQNIALRQGTGGSSFPAWGIRSYTNGTYTFNLFSDSVNFGCTVVWPGNTNEWRGWIPWANIPNTKMSNFVAAMWAGTNVTLKGSGGRLLTAEAINPKDTLEGNVNFVQYSPAGASGRTVRICVPYNYDAITNVPDLIVVCPGNTDNELGAVYDSLDNEGGLSGRDYFNLLCSNNVIVASFSDPNDGTGRKDTWGTSNSVYCVQAALNYVRPRWAYSNVFLWLESAGGLTGGDYLASSNHDRIAGVIFNHAVYSSSNSWIDGINHSDMNFAFGGTTVAQLATTTNVNGIISGDPRGMSFYPWIGVPVHIQQSFGDTTVPPSDQTDLLVTLLGGTPPTSNAVPQLAIFTNKPYTPEISVYGVNGAGGVHGDLCTGVDCATNALNFIKRCRIYAQTSFKRWPGILGSSGGSSNTNNPGILTP